MSYPNKNPKIACDRCYVAASTIEEVVPAVTYCCIGGGRCKSPPAWVFVIQHPEGGIDVVTVCDEHKKYMREAISGTINYEHTEGCTGGDGFAGWADDDCYDYGGPDE